MSRSQELEFDTGARLVPYLDDSLTCAVIDTNASQMFYRSQESEFDTGARLVPYLHESSAIIYITASQMFYRSQESGVRVKSWSLTMAPGLFLILMIS